MNHKEFATAIKAKYPQYSDMSDDELTRAMMAKFPEYSDVDTSGMTAPAAPQAQMVPQQAQIGSMQAIAPSFYGAIQSGQGYGGRTWGATKDFLSFPLRTVAGIGSALGTALGGGSGEDVGSALMGAMASPKQSVMETYGQTPDLQKRFANPLMYAGMAEDPKTIPLSYLGGTQMNPLQQGVIGSLSAYAQRRADETAQGSEPGYMPTLGEALPMAFGAGAYAIPGVGSGMQSAAKSLFRRMVKPGKNEVQGFESALEAGKLPEMAGWSGTVGGAGEQFLKSLEERGSEYPKVLAAADATGNRISTFQAVDAGRRALAKAMADRQLAASIPEGVSAVDWLRGKIQIPSTEEGVLMELSGKRVPANDILPSQAHPIKSSLYEQAFDPNASPLVPKAAKIMAAKGAARDLRAQLGEVSPQYAALNREMAPLYGAEDAMSRAAAIRGNNFHLGGLDILGAGIPLALRTPALARAVYEAGGMAQALAPYAKTLAPVIAAPRQ